MQVIVITSSGKVENETSRIVQLFEHGLDTLHIRKPKLSTQEVTDFIREIPEKYHDRLVLHGKYQLAKKFKLKGVHLKRNHRDNSFKNRLLRFKLRLWNPSLKLSATFHSLQSLRENQVKFDYIFLSNVFSSSSKFNFEDSGLKLLQNVIGSNLQPVIAIGGMSNEVIPVLKNAHFHGAGLSSSIFKSDLESALNQLNSFLAA